MNIIIKFIETLTLFVFFLSVTSCTNENKNMMNHGLVGYWQLSDDVKDLSGNNLRSDVHGSIDFKFPDPAGNTDAARFNGKDTWLELLSNPELQMGDGDFSIAAWINSESNIGQIPGDILSQYDRKMRQGYSLSIKTNMSITGLSNYRQLTFGIDDNISTQWEDCGRPGNALLAFGLVDFKGNLYAGTCEPDVGESGHVYRYAGSKKWIDCGSPDESNSVIALTEFNNELYVGTGRYRVAGSSLPESQNNSNGGRIFRYEEESGKWIDCGQLPGVECTGSMIVYKGELYATSMFSQGFYKYMGGKEWLDCGTPDGKRVENLGIHNGLLYATSWDWAHVYRYDGEKWEDCGQVGGEENTQTYAFAVYEGSLYVATWRSGRVFRFDGINEWKDVGRLGDELEVMGMIVHNGQLLAGTLPLAETYIYEGDTTWRRMDQLDRTPDVTYRRAWTMAEHDGKVFCSTLPSGNIYSYEAGKSATYSEPFPEGWHHVVATKAKDKLQLFLDGNLVSHKLLDDGFKYDSNSDKPIRIGFGPNGFFKGGMRELRFYNRELKKDEINVLMENQ